MLRLILALTVTVASFSAYAMDPNECQNRAEAHADLDCRKTGWASAEDVGVVSCDDQRVVFTRVCVRMKKLTLSVPVQQQLRDAAVRAHSGGSDFPAYDSWRSSVEL